MGSRTPSTENGNGWASRTYALRGLNVTLSAPLQVARKGSLRLLGVSNDATGEFLCCPQIARPPTANSSPRYALAAIRGWHTTLLTGAAFGGEVTAAPDFARHQQQAPLAPRPILGHIEHTRLCSDGKRHCGHPRQGILACFGGGELVVGHNHAPCDYQFASDVVHGLGGYQLMATVTDGGLCLRLQPCESSVL